MSMRSEALNLLHKYRRKAEISQQMAVNRPGITPGEVENLKRKIAVLDWILTLVNKTEGDEDAFLV